MALPTATTLVMVSLPLLQEMSVWAPQPSIMTLPAAAPRLLTQKRKCRVCPIHLSILQDQRVALPRPMAVLFMPRKDRMNLIPIHPAVIH